MDSPAAPPFEALSNRDLAASLTELMGHLNSANQRWLAMLAEFDRRKGWADGLTRTCAHWLNWQCGIDLGAAREKVRVARALVNLPLMNSAMARGELSYAKVRALTRIAKPANEAFLVQIGLHGTAHHVEELVRKYRRVLQAGELSREDRQQANRSLNYSYDDDGSLVLKARLPAELGALVVKALEIALDDLPLPPEEVQRVEQQPDGSYQRDGRVSVSARRADALGLLAESFLAHGAEAMSGGDRFQIVVHVDHDTLTDSAPGRSEFDDGGDVGRVHATDVSAETSRRMACDCSYVKITEDGGGNPLDVGRKTRSIPPALRRALNSRDQGCVFPGCTHTKYIDGHHLKHWSQGGETKLDNLVTLCRFHHRLVHEGGVTIERLDDGAWRFLKRNGESFVTVAPGHTQPLHGDWRILPLHHATRGIHIDTHTARTRWRGEDMDYGIAVETLLNRERVAHQPDA